MVNKRTPESQTMALHIMFSLDPELLLRRTKIHREGTSVYIGRMRKVYSLWKLLAGCTGILISTADCPNRDHSRIIVSEGQATLEAY